MENIRMKNIAVIVIGAIGFTSQVVNADYLGLANGRSADLGKSADLSFEAGVSLESDLSTYATRLNYKVSQDLVVFGDLGLAKLSVGGESADGVAYGFGAFYQLKNFKLGENTDVAVKGSYHSATLKDSNCGNDIFCEADLGELAFEMLISGDSLSMPALGWYANIGMHIVSIDFGFGIDDDSNELSFGGGVTGGSAYGDWYAGVDFIDELFVVGGFRYKVK